LYTVLNGFTCTKFINRHSVIDNTCRSTMAACLYQYHAWTTEPVLANNQLFTDNLHTHDSVMNSKKSNWFWFGNKCWKRLFF